MFLDAVVRRFPALKVLSEAASALRQTGQLSLATAQVEAEGCEETRAGRRFAAGATSAITGLAPVQVTPAALAQWSIFNADPSRAYVFDQLWAYLSNGLSGANATLLYALYTLPVATVNGTGMVIQNMSNGGLKSKAVYSTNVTVTAPSSSNVVWQVGAKSDGAAATGGMCLLADNLKGRLILPPATGLALSILSPTGTTPLFVAGGMWVEKELDLE
jgi:hypothetical protein